MARKILPEGSPPERRACLCWGPLLDDRDQWDLLLPAVPRTFPELARCHARRLRLCGQSPPRLITHMLRLTRPEQPLANFFANGILSLGAKLGPILWQLPP